MELQDKEEVDVFVPLHEGTFNACVGDNGMHDFRTYAEGYIDASILLLETLFEKRLLGSRDTLVHPILYSARHAVELSIKHVLKKLNECDLKTDPALIKGHSLGRLWASFGVIAPSDVRLQKPYREITPIVEFLDSVDPDAQDFRYPEGNAIGGGDMRPTLEGKRIVDLVSVHDVVVTLRSLLQELTYYVDTIVEQRCLGAFTRDLNREQLEELSIQCAQDKSRFYKVTKQQWRDERSLSGKGFERALEFIRNHREFAGNLGIESDLISLSDDLLGKIVEFKLQDIRRDLDDRAQGLSICERAKKRPISFDAYESLKDELIPEVIAELEALYYLTNLSRYSETYVDLYQQYLDNLKFPDERERKEECMRSFIRLFDKSPFLEDLIKSLKRVGKISLSQEYNGKLNALNKVFE